MFDPYLGLVPCAGFPLGEVLVIDVNQRKQLWRQPHGQFQAFLKVCSTRDCRRWAVRCLTSTGIFSSAPCLTARWAYDVNNGELLWKHALPAPGQPPQTDYSVQDEQGKVRQFVVIAGEVTPVHWAAARTMWWPLPSTAKVKPIASNTRKSGLHCLHIYGCARLGHRFGLSDDFMSDENTPNVFNTIEEALTAIRQGEMIMVVDDDDREKRRRPDHGCKQGNA